MCIALRARKTISITHRAEEFSLKGNDLRFMLMGVEGGEHSAARNEVAALVKHNIGMQKLVQQSIC